MKKLFVLALCVLLAFANATQAGVTATPVFAQAPKPYVQQILPATTTTTVILVTAGANGTIIKGINCTNTDTAAASLVQFNVARSAVNYLQTTVNVPLSSGNISAATAPPVNAMAPANWPGLPVDSNGDPFLNLASGDTLLMNVTVTVNSGKVVACTAVGADY